MTRINTAETPELSPAISSQQESTLGRCVRLFWTGIGEGGYLVTKNARGLIDAVRRGVDGIRNR